MCFVSCLYSFLSCLTILHSLPALKYNCHFSYIMLPMVSHVLVSFIMPFGFFLHVILSISGLSSWEISLWGHLECSSFCQRQDWQFQSLLNNCNKWLRISQVKWKFPAKLYFCITHIFWPHNCEFVILLHVLTEPRNLQSSCRKWGTVPWSR